MRPRVRDAINFLVPSGYVELKARRGRDYVLAMRDRRLEIGRTALAARGAPAFSVEEAVRFLTSRGLDESEVRAGSVPQESLDYVGSFVVSELRHERPLLALHIGNFVGVSLAYLSATLRAVHPESQVVSIDPNIDHRGVADPAGHACALLGYFGLLASNIPIIGYTLEQNTGDDSEADPVARFEAEQRPEQVLPNLAAWAKGRFDLVFLDGNHDHRYLARELEQLDRLLRPGALLVLDDVEEAEWQMVAQAFERLAARDAYEELGRDGRLGILRVLATPGSL